MTLLKPLLFTFTLLVSTTNIKAYNDLFFSHLGIENGFASNRANTIIQDQKGFIWVGTWNGLNRYDGYSCKTYQPNFHDSTSISNREITELMEDSFGNIWIGTSNGLNCLNTKTGNLKTYEFRNRILSICEDNNNMLWIGTWNGGLYKLDPVSGKIKHYLTNDIVSDIFLDSRNILWVGTYYGLLKFDIKSELFERYLYDSSSNSISNSTITKITESHDGNIWVGTWGGGLNRIIVQNKGQNLTFTNFTIETGIENLKSNVISELYYDRFNNLWIGTWDQGLHLLKQEQQNLEPNRTIFLNYNYESDNLSSFSGDGVSTILVDRSGILWVGGSTIDIAPIEISGLNKYKFPFSTKISNSRTEKGTITTYKNQLWIASNFDLIQYQLVNNVYQFKKKYDRISYSIDGHQYQSNSILSLEADSSGLWIGTEDAGLIFYSYTSDHSLDLKTKRCFTKQTQIPVSGNKISCIEISKVYPGIIWVGTLQSGFSMININLNINPNYRQYKSGIEDNNYSDDNIRCIKEDKNGNVWIGTQNGLNLFNPTTNKFKQFFYSSSDTNSINDNVINIIEEDTQGNIWIGTNSGLIRKIDIEQPSGNIKIGFKGYPNQEYLKNEIVTNIIEDQSKNLWIRMFKGFVKFNIINEKMSNVYFSKDFENARFERNNTTIGYNKDIIISNSFGFLTLSPDSLLKNYFQPKVVIVDFLIFNESLSKTKGILNKRDPMVTIPYAKQLKISYHDKMITFIFSAMDFKNSKKNEYLYKLEGFDEKWNDINTRNSATYTNLPHGKYIFKVKLKNNNGIQHSEESKLILFVSPPWWKTTWAYFIYLSIIVGLLYFFNKYSIIKAQEKNNLKFEKLKTQEMKRFNEMKSTFFTDITHELKTPLTLILGPANELSSDKSLNSYAAKQAEHIKNSAYKLLRLVNQLMEFRKIEKGLNDKLFVKRCDICELLKEVFSFFEPMAQSRNIDYSLITKDDSIIAYIDPDKIEKVIFNLISNAFKYSMDDSKISVSINLISNENNSEEVVISIEDSGIGISLEHQGKIFERFYQINQIHTQSTGGIGLYMAKALIEQHNGSIKVKSTLGEGSCFIINIPVNSYVSDQNKPIIKPLDIIDSEEDQTNLNNKEEDTSSKKIILVIEDDKDLNDFLVAGLSSKFDVINAFNGKEGLKKARKLIPDLILTDIMMPEMDGFELCKLVRKEISLSHIPVVFLTAKTMEEDEIKGLKLGAVDYIYKPFSLISLKLKINNILSKQKILQDRVRMEIILEPETIELSSLDENFLKLAVDCIDKNLDNPNYDMNAFSNDMGFSTGQVYRKIKALTGQTAIEFIRTHRLKVAAGLLIQNKRSISEIIYMVGFNNPSYFTRCFKELYGCTPKEYIENNDQT